MNSLFPMTRVFDTAFNTCSPHRSGNEDGNARSTVTPRADVLEGDGEFRIMIDLPGVAGTDLDISVEDQTLTVKAGRRTEVPEGFQTRRHERFSQVDYVRTFTLGNAIEVDNIAAGFNDGVLTLTLPKSAKSMPRRIEVK
mgnify:CR=1 FL=1